MKDHDEIVKIVTSAVAARFRSFGGGNVSPNNIMSHALKDTPAVFAARVDIKDVVNAVIELYIAASRIHSG